MKKIATLLIIFLPTLAHAQNYEDLNTNEKHYVDSLIQRRIMIQESQSHHMMVSFTEGSAHNLKPFFTYLLNDLNYYTVKGKDIDIVTTKTGYQTKFYQSANSYQQKELPIIISIVCDKKTKQMQSATINGNLILLVDIYLKYFGGSVKNDTPTMGGLDKTYTITDEVRLYTDKITIKPHHNYLSGK